MEVKMSSDHQDTSGFLPPSTVEELHHQPPSSTTGDILPDSTTLRLPHTPSPMARAIETNPPESPIAASLGGAIFTTPSTSFDGAAAATTTTTATVNTHNPVPRTLTATNSSANQDPPTITTTPPNVSEPPTRNILLRRSHFDQELPHENNKTPPPRVSSSPPKSRTSPPWSSTRNQIPQSKLTKMGDKVREIKQRFWDDMRRTQEHAENDNPPQEMVEKPHNGCFRLELSCSCGKRKGICRDFVFFLNIILILCVFFTIGISYSFLLVLSKNFP